MNNELERYDFRTYRDYLKLSDVRTQAYLMISELIDNSISSMDNNAVNGKWTRELEIDILMDFATPLKQKGDIFSLEVFKNDYLIVKDNAFGMNESKLREAMKLNHINSSSQSSMNTHGRGLKQSGFYFGTDIVVRSNNGHSSHKIGLELSKQESLDSRILFDVAESTYKPLGTKVEIKNILVKNRLTAGAWKKVEEALWERYKKLLIHDDSNNMKINFDVQFIIGSNKGKIEGELEKRITAVEVIELEKIDGVINDSRKSLNIRKMKNSDDFIDDIAEKTFEKISQLLRQAKKDTNTIFEFEMSLNFNGYDTKVLFWMLPKQKAAFRGLRVYENDRAVLHGPIKSEASSTYIEWYDISTRSGSTINRFAGEFNLVDCKLKTTTDKSTFDASRDVKEDMNSKIKTVWEVFDIFVMQGRNEEKKQVGNKTSQKEKDNMEAIFNSKYSNERVAYKYYDSKSDITYIDVTVEDGVQWEFNIKIDTSTLKNKIFDHVIHEEEQKLVIIANTGHMFWKKIDSMSKTKFSSELVQPLCILLGLQLLSTWKAVGDNKINSIDIFDLNAGIFDGNN